MAALSFECPYCGEQFVERDDLAYIQAEKTCPECESTLDDDDLEGLDELVELEEEEGDVLEEATADVDDAVEEFDDDVVEEDG